MDDGTKIFIMNVGNILTKKFSNTLSKDVSLSNYSWFNLGGNAEYFYKAKNKNQLIEFLREAKNEKLKILM